MRRRSALLALPGLALAPALPRAARAETAPWPSRPVRIVVTFPPGGASDIVARVMADVLSQRMNARFVVDNRPGAGGTLGASHVAAQPADGYTLMLSNTAPIVTSPPLYARPGYDPVASFAHVAFLGTTPAVITANKDLVPATDLAGLIAWIKAQPGPVPYGSSGVGSVPHILGVLLEREAGLQLSHIPYRGSAPMQAELLGGSLPLGFDVLPDTVENIRAGRLRAFAVTASARQPLAPEVPTMAELGYPGIKIDNWLGLSAPAGLPALIAERLRAESVAALATPEMRRRLDERGITGAPLGPTEFTALVAQQVRDIGGAVAALGIRQD
ncbi:tripartite tricarboxylate transporter substrate binding protein [Roseomonas nepalensis]|uniref:Tripartite tricarboxylate transporter substrate binding protein n=1 Tax=Muricoccus nepalensis TaxID=1854500 RepID=A0A502GBW0_9PROT|nr:tripartite tricarboxylate transporter substrate binding protein [Roseomonas nepalensis]TPG58516.1 tripartite tricarboxylate transporter substrate binding protein [Roseomonas nepalensis]